MLFTKYCWLHACWAHGDTILSFPFWCKCGHVTCYGQWHASRNYMLLVGRSFKSWDTNYHIPLLLLPWLWKKQVSEASSFCEWVITTGEAPASLLWTSCMSKTHFCYILPLIFEDYQLPQNSQNFSKRGWLRTLQKNQEELRIFF